MNFKIVKTLVFDSTKDEGYQINAAKLEGLSADELKKSVTTDDLTVGTETWILNCGTSVTSID